MSPTGANPTTLHFHITSKCPYNCRHCCSEAGAYEADSLGLEQVRSMINQAVELGIGVFEISGGEPTVLNRQFLLDVVRYASHRGLLTVLNTNGYGLTSEYAMFLSKAGLDKIKLSLYGSKPVTNDAFTGFQGSLTRTLAGIKSSKDAGIEVGVHCVVTPLNFREMLNLKEILEPLSVDTVQLGAVIPTGRGRAGTQYVLSEEEKSTVITKMKKRYEGLLGHKYFFTVALYPEPRSYPFEGRFCNCLVERIVVDAEGNVVPCCLLPRCIRTPLGNIKNSPLSSILSSQTIKSSPIATGLLWGHKALREKLCYWETSHCLCSVCIEMLRRLTTVLI